MSNDGKIDMNGNLSKMLVDGLKKQLHNHTDDDFRIHKLSSVKVMNTNKHDISCRIKGRMHKDTAVELKKLKKKYQREKLADELGMSASMMTYEAGFDAFSEDIFMHVKKIKIKKNEFTLDANVGLNRMCSIF